MPRWFEWMGSKFHLFAQTDEISHFIQSLNTAKGDEYFFGENLALIQCPTLVLWGEADRLTPAELLPQWVNLINLDKKEICARGVYISGAGHSPHLESPLILLNELKIEFQKNEMHLLK